MNIQLIKLEGRKAKPDWDEKRQVMIRYVAMLQTTGYLVAVRRTPSNLDVAHVVNLDIVLCDVPYISTKQSFERREFFSPIDRPGCPMYQFHISASEQQIRAFERLIGKRIELSGLSSIVCWERDDGVCGNLNCFDPEFLDMVDIVDEEEYERGQYYINQGKTPCHVLFNARAEDDQTYTDIAWDMLVEIVKSPVTILKMVF